MYVPVLVHKKFIKFLCLENFVSVSVHQYFTFSVIDD